jgi:hypothetical protein
MQRFEFELSISSQRYVAYYRGAVREVVAQCANGTTVQFPASLLTPFVTVGGIQGRFVLTCDDTHKGAYLARVGKV